MLTGSKLFLMAIEYRSSTKDHEHARRLKNLSRNIEVTENKKVMISRTKFLDNINNKDNLIKLIVRECNKTNIQAEQEEADADTTLVQRAISLTGQGYSVIVTADDAYVLVLLLHHQAKTVSLTASGRTYLIDYIPQKLTKFEKRYLLFSHSFSACDTVSAIFGVGKVRFMNMCKKTPADVLQIFIDANSTTEEVKLAGTKIFQ